MAVEAMASMMRSGAAASDVAALTGLTTGAPSSSPHMVATITSTSTDDNAIEEPEVIMGHPSLRVVGTISLSEVMGMTHVVLNQAHDVLHREREGINEERLLLSVWVDMMEVKEKAEVWQKCLNVMAVLYSRRHAVANKLVAQTQKWLHEAKELYAAAEAGANATIKQQEDLTAQVAAITQRE
jgi:hypothetical protein